jgi:tetratricopeptide (TPR) repeat protein
MKRMFALVFLVMFGSLLCSCREKSLSAQAPKSLPAGLIADSDQEREALLMEEDGKLITARRLADEILVKNPDSIVGHFIVGRVLFVEEGSLPNSLFHLKRALALYEARYPLKSAPETPWRLHSRILLNISWVANDLEDYEAQFWALDEYNLYYTPKRFTDKAWPLMKQKRFAEARAAAEGGLTSTVEWQKSQALNALCAISGEERDRQKGYDDCLLAYQKSVARAESDPGSLDFASDIVVDGHNAAWGALGLLKFEETERLLTEATQSRARTGTNPWQSMVELYVEQGRLTESVSALQEMIAWKKQSPPASREQRRASLEQTLALTLLIAGESRLGYRVATRALEHPDRRANTSADAAQALGGVALLRRALTLSLAEILAEEASAKGLIGGLRDSLRADHYRALSLIDAERVLGVLTDEDRLLATFRLYLAGGLEAPSWLTGDVISIVGPGIAAVMLQKARATETLPGLVPYYDALDAEVSFLQGDWTEALRYAKQALQGLPPKQKLTRARAAIFGAEAAWQQGDTSFAIELFTQAMQQDPGVIRRLGLALPVRIQDLSGTDFTQRVAGRLANSPRLQESPLGFLVTIQAAQPGAEICVESPLGIRLSCATPTANEKNEADAEALLIDTITAFHQRTFAASLGDVMADLRSLDGSPVTASDSMREKTRSLLEELSK